MTRERLEALPALRREITRTKARLRKLYAHAAECDAYACAAPIAAERAALAGYLASAEEEVKAALGYINAIGDATTREIFMLRYYDGVRPWQKVAQEIGEYDESYVRKRVRRYWEKQAESM